jgi:hypothetical protein
MPAGWYDISPSESLDLTYMTPDDGMYILWTPTQQDYINLVSTFGPEASIAVVNYVPPFLEIDLRFITSDETNNTRMEFDYLTLRIFSNEETASDTCQTEFTNLSFNGEIKGTKSFEIADSKRKDIRVPLELVGRDQLSKECKDLIFVSLEYLLDGTWENLWTLNEGMTQALMDNMGYGRQFYLHMKDDLLYMTVDVSQDYFQTELKTLFRKIENEFSIDMRIVLRDGNDDRIDIGAPNEFKLRITGTGEASSCEDALAELDSAQDFEQDLLFKSSESLKDVYVK